MIKALIFDRDGVLIDYDLIAASAFFHALLPLSMRELGKRFAFWVRKKSAIHNAEKEGEFWTDMWSSLATEFKLDDQARQKLLGFNYLDLIYTFDDVRPALLYARERGIKTGVLTNAPFPIGDTLKVAGIEDLIDVALVAPHSSRPKPHPAAYKTIMKELGVGPEECLYFDNEARFVEAAIQLGMQGYLVDRRAMKKDSDLTIIHSLV